MTPGQVVAAMDDPPAYTTVMTILTRLWQKGLLARHSQGRAFAYEPLVSEAELAARRMRSTLLAASDRQGALSHFVGTLSKREERTLRRILDDLDRR